MATVAEFTVPADGFPLGDIFADYPDARVELERIVPTNHAMLPYLWVEGIDRDAVEALLTNRPEVDEAAVVDSIDEDTHLLRLTWNPDVEGIVTAFDSTGVTLLSATGTAESWAFQVRSEDRDAIAAFQSYCKERDVPLTLTGLHALSEWAAGPDRDLTGPQREALALAHDRGYFETPRAVKLAELADELDISRQAMAARIRRGLDRLLDDFVDEWR